MGAKVYVLKASASEDEISKLSKKIFGEGYKKGTSQLHKFSGAIKLKEDPMELQRKWRAEWDRA